MTVTGERDHYLFAYFTTQAEPDGEQVRFARSMGTNPLEWQELSAGRPLLRNTVGTTGVRDPFLLRAAGLPGERARFYVLGTDLRIHGHEPSAVWSEVQQHGSRSIVVWESVDLVTWSPGRLVEVAPAAAGNAWAPEAIFDEARQEYFLFWASKLYEPALERDTQDYQYNRMLYTTTKDFRTFSTPRTWIDPGWSVIDATVIQVDDVYYRFVKDERNGESSAWSSKFITVERSKDLRATTWELVTEGVGAAFQDGAMHNPGIAHGEGPIILRTERLDEFYLFIDEFGLRGYVPFRAATVDSARWTLVESARLPRGASHGSILPITASEWQRVAR